MEDRFFAYCLALCALCGDWVIAVRTTPEEIAVVECLACTNRYAAVGVDAFSKLGVEKWGIACEAVAAGTYLAPVTAWHLYCHFFTPVGAP
jgi:hypothetical protein